MDINEFFYQNKYQSDLLTKSKNSTVISNERSNNRMKMMRGSGYQATNSQIHNLFETA